MKKSDKITFYQERRIKKHTRQEILKQLMCKFKNSNSHKNYWCGVNNSTNEINFYFVKEKNYMKCDLTVESCLYENEKNFCIAESCSEVKKKNFVKRIIHLTVPKQHLMKKILIILKIKLTLAEKF